MLLQTPLPANRCAHCGGKFESEYPNEKTCSEGCRQARLRLLNLKSRLKRAAKRRAKQRDAK